MIRTTKGALTIGAIFWNEVRRDPGVRSVVIEIAKLAELMLP